MKMRHWGDSIAVADPAFRQGGPKKMKNMNVLSIGCEASTARVYRAGGWFGRGCLPLLIFDFGVFEKAIFF